MTASGRKALGQVLAESEAPARPSVAQELVEMSEDTFAIVRGTDGKTYGHRVDDHIAMALRGPNSVRSALIRELHKQTGKVANQNALADAVGLLEARAADNVVEVHHRTARTADGVVIDLGRPDGKLVEVTPDGWKVRPAQPGDPLFARPPTLLEMPIPTPGGSVEPLWSLLNVTPADRELLVGWMATTFLPDVPQPILLMTGEQGTGKTTAAKVVVSLLDPARGGLASPPRNERDWSVMAAGRAVVGLDNLSTIPMWMSDAFCRGVTGDEVAARQLYTDDDLFVLPIRCAIVITSIHPGEIRGDLADRLMPVQLEPIGTARVRETDILANLEEVKESLLGAILDHLVRVLRGLPSVAKPEEGWPRMADFAGVLAALDGELGGDRLSAYLGVATDNQADLLAGDPVVDGLVELLDASNGSWSGSATTLHELITRGGNFTRDQMRSWGTPKLLSGYLRRLQPSLRSVGIGLDFDKSGSARTITVSRLDMQR